VTEDFLIFSSKSAPLADSVKITLTIANKSEEDLEIGVRYLFDTYLGESGGLHFKTDKSSKLSKETLITKTSKINYWVSPLVNKDTTAEEIGLRCVTSGQGITIPDKIVFANWKRLNDTPWIYKTSSSRDFNNLPYSINDSGVVQYYNPQTVARDSSIKIVLVLGAASSSGYDLSKAETETNISRIYEDAVTTNDNIADSYIAVQADIVTLDNLVKELNKKLESGEILSDTDLQLMQKLISELEKRSKNYIDN
jgi:hypothetical protein